jgi:4-amino-4-deoxy-L-arabinose transferase-like glycosyltransferase
MSLRDSRLGHGIILTVVWAVLTLPSLGATSLWDIDEGLNAEAAREMLESGNWIVPSFNFQPRTAKPAMLYWLQVAAYHQFGVNEFAARLPSALAALAVVLLTYELGRRMFDASTGLIAGIVLVTSIQFSLLSHAATPDMLMLAGVMLAFTLFWHGYTYDGKLWLVTTAIGSAIAVLAKGPVGLALPGLVLTLFLLSRGQLMRWFNWRMALGALIFCAIALPWYVLVGSETRGAFLRGFWWNENVNRFLEPLDTHAGPLWFYPAVLMIGLAPWCVFLVPTIWNAIQELRNANSPARLTQRLLLIWAGAYMLFFTVAATKLPNYILPTYPAFALLTARLFRRWQDGELTIPAWIMPTCVASLALVGVVTSAGLVIGSGVIPLAALKGNTIPGLQYWAIIGVIPIIGGVAAWHYQRTGRLIPARNTIATCAIAYLGLMLAFPVRIIDERKAPRELVALAGLPRNADEIRIASYAYFQPSLVFYAQREVKPLIREGEALAHLASPLPTYLITPARVWNEIAGKVSGNCKLLARHHDLYHNTEIVVIGNQ